MIPCPLCRNVVKSLEFHHWDYDHEIGVEICRDCHNFIHEGPDGRVSIQQNRAEYYGLESWHDRALPQLVKRDLKHSPKEELPDPLGTFRLAGRSEKTKRAEELYYTERSRKWSKYKNRLRERYNLPPDELINATSNIWGKHPIGVFDRWIKGGSRPDEWSTPPREAMSADEVIELFGDSDQ